MFADTIKDTRQGRSAAGKETKGPTILWSSLIWFDKVYENGRVTKIKAKLLAIRKVYPSHKK
jgi:hypothetical protein